MKTLLIAFAALFFPIIVFCQDITGLWSGTMSKDSTGQPLPYEVFISKDKGKYTGYSQTVFLIDGEKYYTIKKIWVKIAKDGKIVMKDAVLKENNNPSLVKHIKQLNVLDLVSNTSETALDGLFVTSPTKKYNEVLGRVNLKKTNTFAESSLMRYLQKNSGDNDITVVK